MATTRRKLSWVPSALSNVSNVSVQSDGNGGGLAGTESPRAPPEHNQNRQPRSSAARQAFGPVSTLAPAYDPFGDPAAAAAAAVAFSGETVAPINATRPIGTADGTVATSNSVSTPPNTADVADPIPYRPGSSMTDRRRSDVHAVLETVNQLAQDIAAKEAEISGVKQDLENVQGAIEVSGSYRGKEGGALASVEERLGHRERLLREEKAQLREEKLELSRFLNAVPEQRRGSEEQRRMSRVQELIRERRQSVNSSEQLGDEAGEDTVFEIHKMEEDSRLLVRLSAFNVPILVATLLSGFTLLLFDVAKTDLARRLAVLSFGLETSSSTMLCLISFRGQQLYAHSTDIKPLTRRFLRKMCNVTVLALVLFSLGVIAFVVSFVVEASEELGVGWLAVLGLVLCPTMLAGLMFVISTVQVRRHSIESVPPRARQ
ncbi:hypothetical protein Esi_0058_0112 [Ectocarpus siliculosus]|uniref:Transmembrane protein n=1 Tax=Ectocarpus siliculosus TaxID=2880 RepID=D7G4V7_ECTSI|nr:hypothetical protein Esi_0058_0112 [Ectocarpus siliculosus]|eukprot:CBJ27200.1 hypothetical protein Esi_0058_0112 [Ectocarpus siliculosus]